MEKFEDTHLPESVFGDVEGFKLEVFASLTEMESAMERIRAQNQTEVSGFIKEESGKFAFYYQVGDRPISSELPHELNNSWHSHPDAVSHEAIMDAENIPDELPDALKHLAHNLLEAYKNIDECSPDKPSLIDLINITDHQRSTDRISMPGNLLEIHIKEVGDDTDIKYFADEVNKHWDMLVQKSREKINQKTTEDDFAIYRFEMTLKHYKYATDLFAEIVKKHGFKKFGVNNWSEVLVQIGVPMIRKKLN